MKTKELLKFTRTQLRDKAKPYLFTDEDLLEWLSEGQEKAARNARLLRDYTTPEICRLTLTTVRQAYDLDPRIVFVRRVVLGTRATPLRKTNYRDLDAREPGWIDRAGTPDAWCTDFETGKLWFNRKPSAAGTARIMVVRMPLAALTLAKLDACPEIADAYHRPLHHWALHRAYSVTDTNTFDADLAAIHLNQFHAEFGDDSTAIEEEWSRQKYGEEDMEGEL